MGTPSICYIVKVFLFLLNWAQYLEWIILIIILHLILRFTTDSLWVMDLPVKDGSHRLYNRCVGNMQILRSQQSQTTANVVLVWETESFFIPQWFPQKSPKVGWKPGDGQRHTIHQQVSTTSATFWKTSSSSILVQWLTQNCCPDLKCLLHEKLRGSSTDRTRLHQRWAKLPWQFFECDT